MKILLLGSGGREHALAWKIRKSERCEELYIAPGNAGTEETGINIEIADDDFEGIRKACIGLGISMVVVGPEGPLVKGIVDFFRKDDDLMHIPVIGPDKLAAQLEGSKDFSKIIMERYDIPTARYATFTPDTIGDGIGYIQDHSLPVVLKADGLAAGKGVLICTSREEAISELRAMLQEQKFGEAGGKVVVEEFLEGIELSVFIVTDGVSYKLLPSAKDYKRIGEGDTGLNTGGMGAISPVPFADTAFMNKVEKDIVAPLLEGLNEEGISYKGFLFIGLMNVKGDPYVIEFNCRLVILETEVIIPRLKTDLVTILESVANNTVHKITIETTNETAATVFLVSGGYPGDYEKEKVITGTDSIRDTFVFHAGTKMKENELVTNGGRVLALTSFGASITEAIERSNKAAATISFEGKNFRKDIGLDLI